MLTFRRHPHAETSIPHPWEMPLAAPEDRAVGLELELIELVRRRTGADAGIEQTVLDSEIDSVLGQMDAVAGEVAAHHGLVA